MILPPAFWDSSVLIPLCSRQPTTASVTNFALQYSQVVWWGSAIEIRSGIARLHRLAEIDDYGNHQALQAMESLRRAWREIHPTEAVRNRSFTVLDAYPLRAADSLQLAAALIWCDERPAGKTFLSADIRLCEAAAKSGFTVLIP